jgi:hypothetical protein
MTGVGGDNQRRGEINGFRRFSIRIPLSLRDRGCEIIELKQSPKKVSDSSEPDTFFSGIIVL